MTCLYSTCILANETTGTSNHVRTPKQTEDRPIVMGYEPKPEKRVVFTGYDLDHQTSPHKKSYEESIIKGSTAYDVDSALEDLDTQESDSEYASKELTTRPTEFRSPTRHTNLGKIFPKFDPKSVSSKVSSFRPNSPTYKAPNFLDLNKATLGKEQNSDLKKVASRIDSGLRIKSPTYKAENFVERNKTALGAEKNINLKKVTSRIDSGLRMKSPTYKVSK